MAAPAEPVPQPTPAQQPCAPQVHPFSLIPEGAVLNEGLSSFGSGRVLFSGVVPPNARTEINLNVNSQGGNVSLITVGLATKHPKGGVDMSSLVLMCSHGRSFNNYTPFYSYTHTNLIIARKSNIVFLCNGSDQEVSYKVTSVNLLSF